MEPGPAFHKRARDPNSVLNACRANALPAEPSPSHTFCVPESRSIRQHPISEALWLPDAENSAEPKQFIEDESGTNGRATERWANNSRQPGNCSFCFGTREISQLSGMKPCQC